MAWRAGRNVPSGQCQAAPHPTPGEKEREKELEVTREGHQDPQVYRAGGTERDQRGRREFPRTTVLPRTAGGRAQLRAGRRVGWGDEVSAELSSGPVALLSSQLHPPTQPNLDPGHSAGSWLFS